MNLKGGGKKNSAHDFWSTAAKLASLLRRATFLGRAFWSAAARLGPHLLVHSSEARFAAVRLGLHHSKPCFTAVYHVFAAAKRLEFQALYKYPRRTLFHSKRFFSAPLHLLFLLMCIFFSDFEPSVATMAPKKTVPAKGHRSDSTSQATPPPIDDLCRFISREEERLYHKSLYIRSFISERGFLTSNAFFNFTI